MSTSSPPGKPHQWQTLSRNSGGEAGKHYRPQQPNSRNGSSPNKRKSDSPHHKPAAIRGNELIYHGKYVAFYGGVLSNFHQGTPFSSATTILALLEDLDKSNVPHPPKGSEAVNLLCRHRFFCGEQFMMACKALIFELPHHTPTPSHTTQPGTGVDQRGTEASQPTSADPSTVTLHNTFFQEILNCRSPPDIKRFGRLIPNFNQHTWNRACMAIVTAASLARAEADKDVAKIYKEHWNVQSNTPTHNFVEASPGDRIWGVGLARTDTAIADPKKWRGENRLGKAHDRASRIFNEKLRDRGAGEEQVKETKW